MLQKLFYSPARVKILELLLINSENSYHVREISRLVGVSAPYVSRELRNLEQAGLVICSKRGNLALFKINAKSPIYSELKSIFLKTVSLGSELKKGLLKSGKIKYALIYGSFAKGIEKNTSDIDILIVGAPKELEIAVIISALEQKLSREINYIVWTEKEFKKQIKNKSSFLKSIAKEKIIIVIGDENEFKESVG